MTAWSFADLLPGLYAGLLAALAVIALRRWFDAVPGRVVALFAVAVAVVLGGPLFAGRVLLPLDALSGFAPFGSGAESAPPPRSEGELLFRGVPALARSRAALAGGGWPLWDPYAGAGIPLLGDPAARVAEPLVLAAAPLPLPRAVAVTAALETWLALLFTFLFLRAVGLGRTAAAVGALAYGLGGFVQLALGWPAASAAAALPWILYALTREAREGRRRDRALLVGGVLTAVLAGGGALAVFTLLVAMVYALAVLADRPPEERGPRLGRWLVAAALAVALAAPVLGARADFRQDVDGRARLSEGQALSRRLADPLGLVTWGDPEKRAAWLRGAARRLASLVDPAGRVEEGGAALSGFVGRAALVLAVLALFARRRRLPRERMFLVTAGIALGLAAEPPGLAAVLAGLPLGRAWSGGLLEALGPLSFSVAFLAAATVERLRRSTIALRRVALAVAAVVALELFAFAATVHPIPPISAYFPPSPALSLLADLAADRPSGRLIGDFFTLPPDVAGIYGLRDVRVEPGHRPHPFDQVTAALDRPLAAASRRKPVVVPLLRLLGVRWALTRPRTWLPSPWELAFESREARVWTLSGSLGRLFLPASAQIYGGSDWPSWVEANPDFAARTLVQASPGRERDWRAAPPAAPPVIEARGEAGLAARVDLGEPRLLASSLYQDGGWRLLVDGRSCRTLLSNGPFLAAWLPAGRHRLELVYRPPGFLGRLVVSALALSAVLVWLWPPAVRRPVRV